MFWHHDICLQQSESKTTVRPPFPAAPALQWINSRTPSRIAFVDKWKYSGTLIYNFFENNTEPLAGLKGRFAGGNYSFISEGTASVRQVAFKQDDEWVEGGDAEEKDGKTVFKSLDSLVFQTR